jgi:nucleotide-binding universal stress UspA family protein
MQHTVVVGIDGSAQSAAAARWAAEEADRTGQALRMVHVAGAASGAPEPTDRQTGSLPESVTVLHDRIAAAMPHLEIACERVTGSPSYALAAAGERGGLLVLGSRGRGGVAGLPLGSVGLRTAAHVRCPVVLVRAEGDGAAAAAGEIVVGVQGDRPCDAVLGFAFDQAARRGAVLRAVEARTPPAGPYVTQVPLEQRAIRDSLVADRLVHLQDALSRWREKFPEVRTRAEVESGGAAVTLLEASRGAALVVLGRRAPGHPMAAPRLGSVARDVLRHAHAPVAVVPHG